MKKAKRIYNVVLAAALCLAISLTTGCEWISSQFSAFKEDLIGNSYNINLYDNYGYNILNISGSKVSLSKNSTYSQSWQGDEMVTTEDVSSVITLTVNGNNVETTGSTMIVAESGLTRLDDFDLPENISANGGLITSIDRSLNKFKNVAGTSKILVIQSQLGVPIAVYGGDSVYWEISQNLPKTTKLSIDGKTLYVHRANYILLDTAML